MKPLLAAVVVTAHCSVAASAQTGPQPAAADGGFSVGPAPAAVPVPTPPEDMEAGLAIAAQFLKAVAGTSNIVPGAMSGRPTIDAAEIKLILPEQLAGLRRTKARAQKSGLMGLGVTTAQADYGDAAGARIQLKITDLSGMGPLGMIAGLGWLGTEIDSEGDDGFERTADFQGHKGLEKYSVTGRSGLCMILVGSRFLVELAGDGIDPAQLRLASETINLGALERIGAAPGH